MKNYYKEKAYRFITYEGLFNTIKNKSLRFTRTDKFNDPLDCSPLITPLNWRKYLELEERDKFIKEAVSHMFETIFKSIYVCCFSNEYKSYESYLMWSHYANSHSEVCFEIDFSKENTLDKPIKVNYPQKNLINEREKHISIDNNEELGNYLVSTKSKIWDYEKEVRLIVDIKTPNLDYSSIKFENESFLYLDFDPKHISKIIFGEKSTLHNENMTIGLFESLNHKPKYEKMFINPKNLQLESKKYIINTTPKCQQ